MVNRLAAALNDIQASFDLAIRKAATPRIARALCNLRAEAEERLRRAADGYGRRSPAEIMAETLDRIADLVGDRSVTALAKRAAGPGHRDAALVEPEPEGEELIAALVAIAREFRELATSARKAMKNLGAEADIDNWEKRHHRQLAEALRKQDLQTARIDMSNARRELNALLDQAQIDQAIGEPGEKRAALIPNFHGWR